MSEMSEMNTVAERVSVASSTKPASETAENDDTEQLYKAEVESVKAKLKPRIDKIRESRRVSDRDLQIVINARG